MGLDSFNVAPDNKGGCKSKEEKEEQSYGRAAEGDAFAPEKDSKEWWQEKLDECSDGGFLMDTEEKIPDLCGHVYLHPIQVRIKLEEHDILDTDWDEYVEEYPMYQDDCRIKEHLGISTKTQTSRFTGRASSSSTSSGGSSSGGLSSIVNNAK